MKSNGRFIVLEGIDGCGKTTIAKLLAKELSNTLITKEPTASSKKIHAVLQHRAQAPKPLDFQKLYIADRLIHIKKVIVPALKKGETVICQRYAMSTYAYGMAFGLKEKDVTHEFLIPDVTFILDLPTSVAMERIKKRKEEKEYFEKREKLAKIRKQYLVLAKKSIFGKIIIIDATATPAIIIKNILWHMQ